MNVMTYDVYKNAVKKHDGFNPVDAEKNYTKLQFRFRDDDDWKNCTLVTASFWISNDNIVKSDVELLSDNLTATFDIPPEFSGVKGTLKVGLQGTYVDETGKEVIISTNIITLNRNTGVIITEGANQALYEKLLATFNDYLKKIDSEFDDKINVSLEEYLNAHPELTTTVQDGAITEQKLDKVLLSKLSFITPQMFGAVGDGVTDDTEAIQTAVDCLMSNGGSLLFPGSKTYIISKPIQIITKGKNFEIDFNYCTIKSGLTMNSIDADEEGKYKDKDGNDIETEVNSAIYVCAKPEDDESEKDAKYKGNKRIGTIKNLTIDCNKSTIHTGLYLNHSSKVGYENINFINARKGIYFKSGKESFFNNIHMLRESDLDITGTELDELKVETTDCVGIECLANDNHFSNIIVIDFVVGMKLVGGDNRVYGAHVWNYYCKEQYNKSVCFMNGGANFYTNCVADHFYVGWYLYYTAQMYLDGCNITCQPIKDSSGTGIVPLGSYCFYFGETYAGNKTGSDICVNNTRISGAYTDFNESVTLTFSNIPYCNINYSGNAKNCQGVPDKNMPPLAVYGKTVVDDKNNSKINQYGNIKSVEKVLEFESCSTDFSDVENATYGAGTSLTDFLTVGSETSVTVENKSAIINSTYDANDGWNYLKLHFKNYESEIKENDLIMVAYKYKTNGSSKAIYKDPNKFPGYTIYDVTKRLTGDNEWHNDYMFFTVSEISSTAYIGFGDSSDLDTTNPLYLTDIRVINLSKYNIPKYWLETEKAYRARLIKLFGTEYATSVTIPATTDVSFMSMPCKIITTGVYSEADQMLGFSSLGLPYIITNNNYYTFNLSYINNTLSSVILELDKYTINEAGAKEISVKVYLDNKEVFTLYNASNTSNIVVPSGSELTIKIDIPKGTVCKFSRLNINPYNLSSIPIIDSTTDGSKIPLYADGEICLVAKNKSEAELPTAYFEVQYCKPYYTVEEFEALEIRVSALENK
ncbi:MAG: glycosyl hydrolase family 28-related protein [Ruminococcus sp.]